MSDFSGNNKPRPRRRGDAFRPQDVENEIVGQFDKVSHWVADCSIHRRGPEIVSKAKKWGFFRGHSESLE